MSKRISFEFFPPKTEQGREKLLNTQQKLLAKKPEFFSCTFGAGGSTFVSSRKNSTTGESSARLSPSDPVSEKGRLSRRGPPVDGVTQGGGPPIVCLLWCAFVVGCVLVQGQPEAAPVDDSARRWFY